MLPVLARMESDASSITTAKSEPRSTEGESNTSTTTTATAEPKSTEGRRWADVADDEPEEVPETSDGTSTPPDLGAMTIGDSSRGNQTLADPEDSSIEAVCSLTHSLPIEDYLNCLFCLFFLIT